MISFKTFENKLYSDTKTIPIVGVPSGEFIEISIDEYNSLIDEQLIFYNITHKIFTFNDSSYKKIIDILKINNDKDKFNKIELFLQKINLKKYRIYSDETVDSFENVNIKIKMNTLPIKFEYIMGDFNISNCDLITLKNCPLTVEGNFDCSGNKLLDLVNGPWEVGKDYDASLNELIDLSGSPIVVRGDFTVNYNSLKTLSNGPLDVMGSYYVDNCLLENLNGCPSILKNFDCSFNFLKNLLNGPKKVNKVYNCSHNELVSLKGYPEKVEEFIIHHNKLDNRDKNNIDIINRMLSMGVIIKNKN